MTYFDYKTANIGDKFWSRFKSRKATEFEVIEVNLNQKVYYNGSGTAHYTRNEAKFRKLDGSKRVCEVDGYCHIECHDTPESVDKQYLSTLIYRSIDRVDYLVDNVPRFRKTIHATFSEEVKHKLNELLDRVEKDSIAMHAILQSEQDRLRATK